MISNYVFAGSFLLGHFLIKYVSTNKVCEFKDSFGNITAVLCPYDCCFGLAKRINNICCSYSFNWIVVSISLLVFIAIIICTALMFYHCFKNCTYFRHRFFGRSIRRGTTANLLNVEYRNRGFVGENQTINAQRSNNFKKSSTDTLPTYSFIIRNNQQNQNNQELKY